MATVVEQGTVTGYDAAKGGYGHTTIDYLVVPFFQGALKVINMVQNFSPIDSLSSGRSIRWSQFGLAVLQIIVILGGIFCVGGIGVPISMPTALPSFPDNPSGSKPTIFFASAYVAGLKS